jgi:hypothetical protein
MSYSALLLLAIAALPAISTAQTSAYLTTFATGERASVQGNYDPGDWTVASTKNATPLSYAANAFTFGMASTTSGLIQAQSRFTGAPVTLNSGQFIELKVRFTQTNVLVSTNPSGSFVLGLFDSGGTNPAVGLDQSGLTATNLSAFSTGFAQGWEGYVARISPGTVSDQVYTRPPQVSDATESSSENQDLLFNNVGGGAFDYPSGAVLTSQAAASGWASGSAFTAVLRIERTETSAYSIAYSIYGGTDLTAAPQRAVTGTTIGSNFLSNLSFDGIAIGYRFAAGTGLASSVTLQQAEVTYGAIPEPATYAVILGGVCLGLGLLRRRMSGR